MSGDLLQYAISNTKPVFQTKVERRDESKDQGKIIKLQIRTSSTTDTFIKWSAPFALNSLVYLPGIWDCRNQK